MNAEYLAHRSGLTKNYVQVLIHRGIVEDDTPQEAHMLKRAVGLRDRLGIPIKQGMALIRVVAEDLHCPMCGTERSKS